MLNRLETQMLDALELFYYANKFRSHLFVIVLEDCTAIDELMLDIRMLNASQVRTLLLHPPSAIAAETFALWRRRGFPVQHYANRSPEQIGGGEPLIVGLETVPICELNLEAHAGPLGLTRAALQVAENCGANKVFFLGRDKGLMMGENFLSHLHPAVLDRYLQQGNQFNIDPDKLRLLMEASSRSGIEVVLLDSSMGSLYEETFTHRGSGSLFTSEYPNILRRGQKSDLMDLFMLIKHEMLGGSILPVNEEELADNISNYFVFTVNGLIVAAATLIDYGCAMELAKFCTLPRYQGKGRAMQLARSMIEEAAALKKDYVFALSINDQMWTFFRNLGFSEIDRAELPKKWQEQYDFSRPSRAFRLQL